MGDDKDIDGLRNEREGGECQGERGENGRREKATPFDDDVGRALPMTR